MTVHAVVRLASIVLLWGATAVASPLQARVSVAAQQVHDVIGEQDGYYSDRPPGRDGGGPRIDLAVGLAGMHIRLGASTLPAGLWRRYSQHGNFSGYSGNESASAMYLRLGAGFERALDPQVIFVLGAGLVWARTELEVDRTSWYQGAGGIRYDSSQMRDATLHWGGWIEVRLSFLPLGPRRHSVSVDVGLAFEKLVNNDPTTEVTRAGVIPFMGVAYRWN